MISVDVTCRCETIEDVWLVKEYLEFKGHRESNGTLVVDPDNLVVYGYNAKKFDTPYVSEKMAQEAPEPPIPYK